MKIVYKCRDSYKGSVVYHNTLSNEIQRYLLPNLGFNSSIVDPKVININVIILALFVKNFYKINRNIPFKRFLFLVYQYSTIELVKPKVVLTYIDNSIIFQWLAANYHEAEFYAIQNGSRSRYELYYQHYYNYKNNLTNFFCFGDYERIKYNEYGHSVENFIPAGSFAGSIFEVNHKDAKSVVYDFALISQHKINTFEGSGVKLKETLERIDDYLSNYLRKNNKLTCIVLCRSKKSSIQGKMERRYFKSVYGNRVDLRFQDDMDSSTYCGIKQSSIIIGCNSTVMIVAAGLKKKVLFCDYSNDNIWADYPDGLWLHTENNYTSFKDRVDNIRLSNLSDYSEFYNYIISYNNNTSAIDIIKREIYSKLGKI